MKKILKKTHALLLSVALLLTSLLPFAAFADDTQYTILQAAISVYEANMKSIAPSLSEGTAYTGLSDTYDKYVAAKQAAEDYLTDGTEIDSRMATSLITAANAIKSATWSPATATGTGYYDTVVATGGYSSLLYSSQTLAECANATDIGDAHIYLYTPKTVIMLYDGNITPSFPVGFGSYCSTSSKAYRTIGYVYLSTAGQMTEMGSEYGTASDYYNYANSTKTSGDSYYYPESTISNVYELKGCWYGEDFTTNNAFYTNGTKYFGYSWNNSTGNEGNGWNPGQGESITHYLTNTVYLKSDYTPNEDTYLDEISGTASMYYCVHNYGRDSNKAFDCGATQYILNYKPVADKAAEKAKLLGQALTDNKISDYSLGGLAELMQALDAFTGDSVNPNTYSYGDDETAVASATACAAAIQAAVGAYGEAKAGYTDDKALEAITDAISAYETVMSGVVLPAIQEGATYANLSAAYEAYIAACAALDAYTYGSNTRTNLITAAQALTSATAAMQVWARATFDATVYHSDSENLASAARYPNLYGSGSEHENLTIKVNNEDYTMAFEDFYSNVVYCSRNTTWPQLTKTTADEQTNEDDSLIFKIPAPENMVLAYDGETKTITNGESQEEEVSTTIMPVAFEINNFSDWGESFRVFTVNSQSGLFSLKNYWAGPAKDYKYQQYPTDFASGQAGIDSQTGYQTYDDSESTSDYPAETKKNEKGFLANKYYFNKDYDWDDNSEENSNYLTDYVAKESSADTTWRVRFKSSGSDANGLYAGTLKYTDDNGSENPWTVYVINYQPVLENTEALTDVLAVALTATENGVADYKEGGLADLLAAIDNFTSDSMNPMSSEYDYSDKETIESVVTSYSTALAAAVETAAPLTDAVPETDSTGYQDLTTVLDSESKIAAQYAAGNYYGSNTETGVSLCYTYASWQAFTTAYEAAKTIAYNLASTGYTDDSGAAAAAAALQEAYEALTVASTTSTGGVTNTFTAAGEAEVEVQEDWDEDAGIKENVKVTNKADYSTYVRAAIIVSWVSNDDDTVVYAQAPTENEDYTMELNLDQSSSENGYWFKGSDGLYYYSAPLASGESTENLITKAVAKNLLEGYHLQIQIVAYSIQSAGTVDDTEKSFVEYTWDADEKIFTLDDDGALTPVSN